MKATHMKTQLLCRPNGNTIICTIIFTSDNSSLEQIMKFLLYLQYYLTHLIFNFSVTSMTWNYSQYAQ